MRLPHSDSPRFRSLAAIAGVDIPPFAWSALERSTSRPKEHSEAVYSSFQFPDPVPHQSSTLIFNTSLFCGVINLSSFFLCCSCSAGVGVWTHGSRRGESLLQNTSTGPDLWSIPWEAWEWWRRGMAHVAHVARVAHVAQRFGSCELFAHHRGTMEYHFLTWMKKIHENPALLRAESLSTRAGHPSTFSHIFAAILDLSPTKATGNELSSWHGSRLPVSACPAGIPKLPCGSPRWNTHWLSRGGPQAWSAADLHRFL